MSYPSQYINEYQRIKEQKVLTDELIKGMSSFFNWNSMPHNLKDLDRSRRITQAQDSYDNGKISKGDENQLKIVNIYTADRKFCQFLHETQFDGVRVQQLKFIFSSHMCISVNILQYENSRQYVEKLISEVKIEHERESINKAYAQLKDVINQNPRKRNFRGLDHSKFIIEQKTIDYLGIHNISIISCLNKTNYSYELESNDKGDLIITFKLYHKKLKTLEIASILANSGLRYPLKLIGYFKEE